MLLVGKQHDADWPWADYGPVVMAAVRAGVPVAGANLPRAQTRTAMQDSTLDARLPAPRWPSRKNASAPATATRCRAASFAP